MYSFSIDYLFNRVYDALLWIKYTWLFTILRSDPDIYLREVSYRDWDGLRDRGWFDEYLSLKEGVIPHNDHTTLWQKLLESLGIRMRDSDGDGIPDVSDSKPFDRDNLTKSELKERYQADYDFGDRFRNFFGIAPKDTDKDGVPDSYEDKHGLNKNDPDTDHDGVFDGQELVQGTDPHNPDSDGDLVLDGRDEAPLDTSVSSIGPDTDGDGVSDKVEAVLGTDIHVKDTDHDGIADNMDTYPLDPHNTGTITPLDLSSSTQGLHFSVQNPVLAFVSDVFTVLSFPVLIALVYASARWFIIFVEGLTHYEHHFHHDDHADGGHHVIQDTSAHHDMPAGIAGLPVGDGVTIAVPTAKEYEDHPKFAIIQGYMSSTSEALWRIGVLEADNVLLEVLAERGYAGDGVGEKLKQANFRTIDLAWDAHKIRNRIAHEGSDFQLTEREAKRAFMLYESVFRDLKVIR